MGMRKRDENRKPETAQPTWPKRRPRVGWADAFGDIEELGDEDRAWLEFGNDEDAYLRW